MGGAGASNVGNAEEELGGALLKGVDGWHRLMIGGAAGDDLGGVVGGELSWSGGAASPVGGVACWQRSMIGGVADDGLGGVVEEEDWACVMVLGL